MKKQYPRIIRELIKEKNKIIKMTVKDVVTKFGDKSGHILLPGEIVGKYVMIIYDPEGERK